MANSLAFFPMWVLRTLSFLFAAGAFASPLAQEHHVASPDGNPTQYDSNMDPCAHAGGLHTVVDVGYQQLDWGNAWPWDLVNRIQCPDGGNCDGASFTGETSYQGTTNDWYQENVTVTVAKSDYANPSVRSMLMQVMTAVMQNVTKSNPIGPCSDFNSYTVGQFPCPPGHRDNSKATYVQHLFPNNISVSRYYGDTSCGEMTVEATIQQPNDDGTSGVRCAFLDAIAFAIPALLGVILGPMDIPIALFAGLFTAEECNNS